MIDPVINLVINPIPNPMIGSGIDPMIKLLPQFGIQTVIETPLLVYPFWNCDRAKTQEAAHCQR